MIRGVRDSIESIRWIMKDGKIYRNELAELTRRKIVGEPQKEHETRFERIESAAFDSLTLAGKCWG